MLVLERFSSLPKIGNVPLITLLEVSLPMLLAASDNYTMLASVEKWQLDCDLDLLYAWYKICFASSYACNHITALLHSLYKGEEWEGSTNSHLL